MTDLPAFSGNTPTCVKCGHEGAQTVYRTTGECQYNGDQIMDTYEGTPNERLCRRCERCDYHWDEAVVEIDIAAETLRDVAADLVAALDDWFASRATVRTETEQ